MPGRRRPTPTDERVPASPGGTDRVPVHGAGIAVSDGAEPPGPPYGGPPTGGPWTPRAHKPGVIPLRPLELGEILGGAFSAMRIHWRAMVGVSLMVAAAFQMFDIATFWWGRGQWSRITTSLAGSPDTGHVLAGSLAIVLVGTAIATFVSALLVPLAIGPIIFMVRCAILGKPVTLVESWRDARPQRRELVVVVLLIALWPFSISVGAIPGLVARGAGLHPNVWVPVLVLGLAAAAGVTCWLVVSLILAIPALMLEKRGVKASLSRSFGLVRGSWWRVFGVVIVAGIVTSVIRRAIEVPFAVAATGYGGTSFAGHAPRLAAVVAADAGSALCTAVTLPIIVGVAVILYVDQRMRREGFGLS